MKHAFPAAVVMLSLTPYAVAAGTFTFGLTGPGVSGHIIVTYGSAHDANYPRAFEVTNVTGVFSDTNNGLNIMNQAIGPLVPIVHDTPESGNTLAPHDFSRFPVAAGLPAQNGGFLTYDNLFWPGGSPQTASSYPPHGGFLDIYGLMFHIGSGQVVNIWSGGTPNGSGVGPIYGVAVATSAHAADYVGGVSVTPEPSALTLMAAGIAFLALVARRRAA